MLYLEMKSASLWEACASSILAPIEVPERSSWFASVRETPGFSSKERHNFTILIEKLKALSGISDFILRTSLFKLQLRSAVRSETFSAKDLPLRQKLHRVYMTSERSGSSALGAAS